MSSPRPLNVLVFPAGSEIGMEVRASLAACKEVRLFGTGVSASNHAPFVFRHYLPLPSIHEPGWIDALNVLIDTYEIDYIYPAYDDVILALQANADRIKAPAVASPLVTCEITRSKSATYAHLRGSVRVPSQYADAAEIPVYPVFVKPDAGQGSQHSKRIDTEADLEHAMSSRSDLITLEYLPGAEFTVDCFSDREQGLLYCHGRERVRTRSGISMNTRPVVDRGFRVFAEAIASRLELHGAWFYQVKEDAKGELKLLEVAPRLAGTSALNRVMGVNFALLSILEQERVPLAIMTNDVSIELDRALVARYEHDIEFSTVYVDLDDTLIHDSVVNSRLVRLLYECINRSVRLVLLTRHRGDLAQTLATHRLTELFDEVISVPDDIPKSKFVRDPNSIFIDDSFSERRDIVENCGIHTFDTSMIDLLLDDRS